MAAAAAIDPARVIADLRELAGRTSDDGGAQRLCWGPGWRRAREYLGELLAELGLERRDVLGDRRLRDVQLVRGTRERSLAGDRRERPQARLDLHELSL